MAAPAGPTNRDRAREQGKYRGNAGSRRPGDRTRSRSDALTNPRAPITPGSLGAQDLERLGVTRNGGAGARPGGADRPASMPGGSTGSDNNRMGGFKNAPNVSAGMAAGSHIKAGYDQERQSAGRTQTQSGAQGAPRWDIGKTASQVGSAPNDNIVSPQELLGKEQTGNDQVGKGYTGGDEEDKELNDLRDELGKKKKKKGRVFALGKKRGIIFGSVLGVGAVGGFTLFTTTLAPLQFIHISQTLSQHFDAQQDADDESIVRIYRYIRFLNKGTPERTRLGALRNKYADRFEARLNATGLKSMYTNLYGFINGYAIDREHPEFKNMTDEELREHVKEKYGLDVVKGETLTSSPEAKGKWVIDAKTLGVLTNGRALLKAKLQQSGLGWLGTAMGLRLLTVRSGAGLHPMTLQGLDQKILRSAEDLFNKMRERRAARLANGTAVVPGTDSKSGGETEEERRASQNAADTKGEADKIIQEGKTVNSDIRAGKPGALTKFSQSTTAKMAGGGAAAVSAVCLLRAIATDSGAIKRAQVIDPAIRSAVEKMALGSQLEYGTDFDSAQLAFYESYLSGKDSRGVTSSFSDGQAWNAMESTGDVTGVAPNATLQNIGKGTPFDFLNQGATGATLDVACSAAVQVGLTVVTFLGGPITAVVGIAAGIVAVGPLAAEAGKWLAGSAIDIESRGADSGNLDAYGGRLAANEQAIATGGNILSTNEEKQLNNITSSARREEFSQKSLAYRLFNPRDYRTPVAKLIDQQSTQNVAQNVASAVRGFMNMGSALGDQLATLASGRTHAMSPNFDWGFGKVGMSVAKMQDPRFQNPYESSERTAATLLEGPDSQKWIDRAAKCNAVTIAKDSDGKWGATSSKDKSPTYQDLNSAECLETSYEWTSIQWFIHYTMAMEGEACRIGGEAESCTRIGFQPAGGVAGGGGSPIGEAGDPRALARQLLLSPNIRFQKEPSQRKAFEQVAIDGTQTACGTKVTISAELLAVLVKVSQTYKIVLGVFAAGHDCGSGYHPRGMAVDINGVAKGNVTTGNFFHLNEMNASQMALAKEFYEHIANTFPENKGGLGQVQCFPNPQPGKRAGVAYFNDACHHLHVDVRRNK